MSTADDAERDGVLTNGTREPYERGYADGRRAGYRLALEDAAELVKSRFEHGRLTTDECELVETWLRDRAAGVGTKDGDDDRPHVHQWIQAQTEWGTPYKYCSCGERYLR